MKYVGRLDVSMLCLAYFRWFLNSLVAVAACGATRRRGDVLLFLQPDQKRQARPALYLSSAGIS